MTISTPASEALLDPEVLEQFFCLARDGASVEALPERSERNYEALYALGHSLYVQGRYHEASQVFGVLSAHRGIEPRIVRALAASLQMQGAYEDALQQYALWILIDNDDNPVPVLQTCECLIQMGKTSEALEGLSTLVEEYDLQEHTDVKKRAEGLIALIKRSA